MIRNLTEAFYSGKFAKHTLDVGFLFRLYARDLSKQYGHFPTVRAKEAGIIMSVSASLQLDMLKILLMGPKHYVRDS